MTSYGATRAAVVVPCGRPRGLLARSVVSARLSWREARPIVQCVVALRLCTAVLLLAGPAGMTRPRVLLACGAFVAANSTIYLFNGLCDQVEDRCNGKQRPLAQGQLSTVDARAWLVVWAVIAVLAGLVCGPWVAALVFGQLVAGTFYSWRPWPVLRMPFAPVVLIAFAGTSTYLTAAAALGVRPPLQLVAVALAMSGWMAVVGGVLKDVPDVHGDRIAGRRTIAVLHGPRRAARLGARSAWACTVPVLLAAIVHPTAVMIVAAGALLTAAAQVQRAVTNYLRRDGAACRPYRAFMRGQYAVHAAVVAAVVVTAAVVPTSL